MNLIHGVEDRSSPLLEPFPTKEIQSACRNAFETLDLPDIPFERRNVTWRCDGLEQHASDESVIEVNGILKFECVVVGV